LPTHPLFWLAILTFLLVAAWALWSLVATRRQMKYGDSARGIGSPQDPMS
jgi:hypothetical protein